MKNIVVVCVLLFGGAEAVFAQNQTVTGTLTVQQDVFLNTSSGNTSMNGNVTLGSSSSNTIDFNGIAGTAIEMADQNISDVQNIALGVPSGSQYTPVNGTISFFTSTSTNRATMVSAVQGGNFLYTIPNAGASASFVVTQGAQTINGGKTFASTNATGNTAPLIVNNTHASGSGNNALGATITSTGTSTGGTNTALTLTASSGTTNNAMEVTSGNLKIDPFTTAGVVLNSASGVLSTGSVSLSSNVSGTLPVLNGGTGATTPTGALTNLGAAASGANSDITSLTALTTPLPTTEGGTGLSSVTANEVVIGNTSGTALTQVSGLGNANQVLTSNGAGFAPSWKDASGLVTSVAANDGSLTISPNTGAVKAALNTGNSNEWTVAQTFDVPISATSGGTGTNTYATGDVLVASSTTALSRLAKGTDGQVLGVDPTTHAVSYITNGATVTPTIASDAVSTNQSPYTVGNSIGYIRLSNTNSPATQINVSGISSSGVPDGRSVTVVNVSSDPGDVIQITNLDASSASVDEFDLPGGRPILLGQKGAATFLYDTNDNADPSHLGKWVLVSTND
jgi:hypothetical protein